jgi:hypothetical protein
LRKRKKKSKTKYFKQSCSWCWRNACPILQCISSKTNRKQSLCNKMTSSLSQLKVLLVYVDFLDWHLIIKLNHIDFKLTKQSNVNNKENLYCCLDHIVYAFGINKLLNHGCKNYANIFVATFHVFITIVVKYVFFQQSLNVLWT